MNNNNSLTVTIQPPRAPAKEFTLPKTEKVADVLEALKADADLKLAADGTYDLIFDNRKLDPKRTLVSYGIEDGAKIQVSADGGGV